MRVIIGKAQNMTDDDDDALRRRKREDSWMVRSDSGPILMVDVGGSWSMIVRSTVRNDSWSVVVRCVRVDRCVVGRSDQWSVWDVWWLLDEFEWLRIGVDWSSMRVNFGNWLSCDEAWLSDDWSWEDLGWSSSNELGWSSDDLGNWHGSWFRNNCVESVHSVGGLIMESFNSGFVCRKFAN